MMLSKISAKVTGFLRWLFGAPVSELPPAFGDTVPAELRVFEEEMEHIQEVEQPVKIHQEKQHPQTNPPKKDVPIERL
ncbi:MAG: hypothetical protein GXP38_16890 [Chloroflexi bacterium]|nr:hypothetical protein [Chloroflexota bacterium]